MSRELGRLPPSLELKAGVMPPLEPAAPSSAEPATSHVAARPQPCDASWSKYQAQRQLILRLVEMVKAL